MSVLNFERSKNSTLTYLTLQILPILKFERFNFELLKNTPPSNLDASSFVIFEIWALRKPNTYKYERFKFFHSLNWKGFNFERFQNLTVSNLNASNLFIFEIWALRKLSVHIFILNNISYIFNLEKFHTVVLQSFRRIKFLHFSDLSALNFEPSENLTFTYLYALNFLPLFKFERSNFELFKNSSLSNSDASNFVIFEISALRKFFHFWSLSVLNFWMLQIFHALNVERFRIFTF